MLRLSTTLSGTDVFTAARTGERDFPRLFVNADRAMSFEHQRSVGGECRAMLQAMLKESDSRVSISDSAR